VGLGRVGGWVVVGSGPRGSAREKERGGARPRGLEGRRDLRGLRPLPPRPNLPRSSPKPTCAAWGVGPMPASQLSKVPPGRSGRTGMSSSMWRMSSLVPVACVGWGGGDLAVGSAAESPAALRHAPVMSPAHQSKIGRVGRAAIQPVDQMMPLPPGQRPSTTRNDPAPIAHGQGAALGRADHPGGPAQVQGLGGGPTQDRGQQGQGPLKPGGQPILVAGSIGASRSSAERWSGWRVTRTRVRAPSPAADDPGPGAAAAGPADPRPRPGPARPRR
jgi:hypothetical protein